MLVLRAQRPPPAFACSCRIEPPTIRGASTAPSICPPAYPRAASRAPRPGQTPPPRCSPPAAWRGASGRAGEQAFTGNRCRRGPASAPRCRSCSPGPRAGKRPQGTADAERRQLGDVAEVETAPRPSGPPSFAASPTPRSTRMGTPTPDHGEPLPQQRVRHPQVEMALAAVPSATGMRRRRSGHRLVPVQPPVLGRDLPGPVEEPPRGSASTLLKPPGVWGAAGARRQAVAAGPTCHGLTLAN